MRWMIIIILFLLFPSLCFTVFETGATLTGLILIALILLSPLIQSLLIFPLPVRDTGEVRYRSFPWATATLIVINCAVFLMWQGRGYFQSLFATTEYDILRHYYDFIQFNWTYGWRKTFIFDGASIGAMTTFTAMFMHGDLNHLFGNMAYLWAFGRRVEDGCGPWRYLAFYLLAGMVSHIASAIFLDTGPLDIPSLGASGAISGVLGAYLLLYFGSRVDCLWGVAIGFKLLGKGLSALFGGTDEDDEDGGWKWTLSIPAWILLIFYAVSNIVPSFQIIQGVAESRGVNTIAHMFGFLAAIGIFLFTRKDLLTRYMAGRRL